MFDIHQKAFDEDGGWNDDRAGEYIGGLMDEFLASPEGQALIQAGGNPGYVDMFLDYGLNYPGVTPADMSLADFNEVVFDIIPRKVSTEPENAPEIISALQAFWSFVHRQYGLTHAEEIHRPWTITRSAGSRRSWPIRQTMAWRNRSSCSASRPAST